MAKISKIRFFGECRHCTYTLNDESFSVVEEALYEHITQYDKDDSQPNLDHETAISQVTIVTHRW